MSARGCLSSIGSLFMLFVIAAMVIVGIAVFLEAQSPAWRGAGAGSIALAGVLMLVLGRSDKFATVLAFLHAPLEFLLSGPDPTIVATDYRRVAGVHPGPGVMGVLLLIAAAMMGLAVVVP